MMMELVNVGEQMLVGELVKLMASKRSCKCTRKRPPSLPGDKSHGREAASRKSLRPVLIGTIYDGISVRLSGAGPRR